MPMTIPQTRTIVQTKFGKRNGNLSQIVPLAKNDDDVKLSQGWASAPPRAGPIMDLARFSNYDCKGRKGDEPKAPNERHDRVCSCYHELVFSIIE